MAVDVVIVNWNSGSLIVDCINSLLKCENELSKIIVVDNASTDGSHELIAENYKSVTILRNKENLGFGKACNIGVAHCESEYILFLNPDTVVTKDSILKSLIFMREPKNFSYGAIGIKLHNDKCEVARSSCRFPTLISMLCHSIGLDRLFPKTGYFMIDWDHMDSREVNHVIGAFYLIRREIFETLNGFDERFYVYFEDLDLSLRINNLGYKIYYFSDAEAYHVGGGTSGKVKDLRLFFSLRSRLMYVSKHFSIHSTSLIFITTLFLEPIIRILSCVFKFDFAGVTETFKGYFLLFRWLPLFFLKNKTHELSI